MKGQRVSSTVRTKTREKEQAGLKNDLKLKREAGKLGILMLYLLGIVVGALSLSAMVSGLLQVIR